MSQTVSFVKTTTQSGSNLTVLLISVFYQTFDALCNLDMILSVFKSGKTRKPLIFMKTRKHGFVKMSENDLFECNWPKGCQKMTLFGGFVSDLR